MERMRGRYGQPEWKRYALPVGIAAVVLLLAVSACGRGGGNGAGKAGTFVEAAPATQGATVKIAYAGANEAAIEKPEKVYAGEKVVAEKGEALVTVTGSTSSYRLRERARLRFLGSENGEYRFQLETSEVWVREQSGNSRFLLTYADVKPAAGSVLNLSQNQIATTVYVVAGTALVTNKSGTGGALKAGEKAVMTSGDPAANPAAKASPIDEAFRQGAWFKANGGDFSWSAPSASSEARPSFSSEASAGSRAVTFSYPQDNMALTAASVSAEGTAAPGVARVSFGGKEAAVDAATRKFSTPVLQLQEGANDLVWKALDADGATVAKGVLTVFAPAAKKTALPNKPVTYPISDKDFKVTAPAQNPYTMTGSFVKIVGEVPAGTVEKITVNDYQLKTSFRAGGSSWYYFANADYGTLAEGVNLYKIRYYGKDGAMLRESLFTIVRKTPAAAPAASGEASAR